MKPLTKEHLITQKNGRFVDKMGTNTKMEKEMKTRNKVKGYIQQSKEDWWDCKCGKQHKGFPYKCPLGEKERMWRLKW